MASHDLVNAIQQERRQEAAESNLAARPRSPEAPVERLRLALGLRLIAAGRALAGDAARPRAGWTVATAPPARTTR
jgi:hypothetical protein